MSVRAGIFPFIEHEISPAFHSLVSRVSQGHILLAYDVNRAHSSVPRERNREAKHLLAVVERLLARFHIGNEHLFREALFPLGKAPLARCTKQSNLLYILQTPVGDFGLSDVFRRPRLLHPLNAELGDDVAIEKRGLRVT